MPLPQLPEHTGGSVNAVVPVDLFKITKGEPKPYDDSATKSGRTLSRFFLDSI